MSVFSPASEAEIAYHRQNLTEYEQDSDVLRHPKFSPETLAELACILDNKEAARLVLTCVRLGDYGNSSEYWVRRYEVGKLLRLRGIPRRKGKRPKPGFSEFVEATAPMLIYFGLRPSTSERARLVRALRVIGDGLGISGDPREELRRQARIDRRNAEAARKVIDSIFAEALAPKKN